MGWIRHNAIVVTATYYRRDDLGGRHWIEVAHEAIADICADEPNAVVTDPTPAVVNGTRSLLVAPDGSKEGWESSDEGDRVRGRVIEWLRSQPLGTFEWVEVQYGDERDYDAKVLRSSDADRAAAYEAEIAAEQ